MSILKKLFASRKLKHEAKQALKKTVKSSVKKHPFIWIAAALVILVIVFLLTPLKNPLEISLVFDSVSEELAIPAYSKDDIVVQHTGYTLCYSEEHEQPYWVAYLLTADEVFAANTKRSNNFREDPSIPTGSATLEDYKGSGYDRGHLCPAADQLWSARAMEDSFFLSNMSPQKHSFNAGIWLDLESAVRTFAAQNREICVVTGPVLTDGPYKTIGPNKVSVPKSFYKVILDYYGPEKKAIGFILAQDDRGRLKNFAVSVDEVESVTGLDFFPRLRDDEEAALESSFNVNLWDISDFSRNSTARRYGYDLSSADFSETTYTQARPEGPWQTVRYFLFIHCGKYKQAVIDFVKDIVK